MRLRRILVGAVATIACCSLALASTPTITYVAYPEGQSVSLVFAKTDAAPEKASLKGTVKYETGQAQISLSYSGMQPAVLFGGDIAAYVVWAVSKSAAAENLGELVVSKSGASGSQKFSTPRKNFGIMVTAEPYYLVSRPFDLVMFTSSPKDASKAPGESATFDDFRPGPEAKNTSIAGMKYEDKTPVPVKQAEAALALVDRLKASEVNPSAVQAAHQSLGEAKAASGSKAVADAARRSISSSAEALRAWGKSRDELAAAKTAEQHAQLERNLQGTQQKLTSTEAEKAEIAKQRDALTVQRDALTRDQAKLKAERDALAAKLQSALGAVADTKSTARGTVTSLSGVLFDTGKSTLKPDAKITLAKLAGIMLVFSKTTIQVEGYTDNVGSDASNMKLSEDRAKAVREFLESQGIASNRLTSTGKGPADPVASNDTPDGRSKNRRVEIISSEPQL
jgi:outer membrane protein OmpA-like peptidoglycan-associated protein